MNSLGCTATNENSTALYPTEDSTIFDMATNPLNNSTQVNPLL